MARVDLPPGDGLDVGRALTISPHFVDVVVGYEKAVAQTTLDPRLHDLVRYRVAQLNQCAVCLAFRQPASGGSEELLAAVVQLADKQRVQPAGRAALAFTLPILGEPSSI